MPRIEIDNAGNLVTTIPSALSANLDALVQDLFSQNSWTYVENSKSGAYRDVTLTAPDGTVYNLDLFTANVRNESRNDAEKKIQLGGADPRIYTANITLILGFYVNNPTASIGEAVIVGYPVKGATNYPTNPSLRSTFVDGILVNAKRNGFSWDQVNGVVAFRPEFIFYYVQNYKRFHGYPFGTTRTISPITSYSSNKPRNLIVFGAPGTGKSHYLKMQKDELLAAGGGYERVTFHPDYTYSQFVGSYKPVTDSNGEIAYKFVPGPFMRVFVEAYKSSMAQTTLPYLLIIEEVNRAKVSAVFGEVFQLLDRINNVSEYPIMPSEDIRNYLADNLGGTPDSYKEIQIPDNMFIWASMNSADQGVFPMDTAFKRRWSFKYIGVDEEEFSGTGSMKENNVPGKFTIGTEIIEWNILRRAINAKLSSREMKVHEDKLMGPFFIKTKELVDAAGNFTDEPAFIDTFKQKVLMYLFEDVAKTKGTTLFEGCQDVCSRYSYVCDAFDNDGIGIFGKSFKADYYDKEKVKADAKYAAL